MGAGPSDQRGWLAQDEVQKIMFFLKLVVGLAAVFGAVTLAHMDGPAWQVAALGAIGFGLLISATRTG